MAIPEPADEMRADSAWTTFAATPLEYVATDDEQTTITEVLTRRADLTPDAVFVSFEGMKVTFGEFKHRAEQAGAALAYAGISRGDKVAVMLPNSLEFLDLWFGSALLGAVLVPINTGLRGAGLAHVLTHSDSALLVAEGELVAECEKVLDSGAGPRLRYARGAGSDWDCAHTWLRGSYQPAVPEAVTPGDVASILYTSGTTGPSKGVVNCHNAFAVAANEFCRRHVEIRSDDVLYTSLPLFHVNAQMLSVMGAMVSGRPLVLAPRFRASGILDDLRGHGATIFNYIGAMLTMIAKQPIREDDAANPARLAIGGAAPAQLWKEFERRFALSIVEIYGLTETATFCLGSPPADVRVGKVGRSVSWADVRIEASDGAEQNDGQPGEVVIRSKRDNVMFSGYYKDPEATARAMSGGWFHTGDRGRRDESGYFEFIDRIKDIIRRRGENISSFEVERVVNSHDAVTESAVVGVPSDLGEEDVLAVVVPANGSRIDPGELIDFCRERLGAYMVPRYVRVVDTLPRTATERIQKYILRNEARSEPMWDREAGA